MERTVDLIVEQRGAFLSKRSERLQVKIDRAVSEEVPFFRLRQIVVVGRAVSLSSDVVEECALNGIPLHFLSFAGEPIARVSSPDIVGTVLTRREQILSFQDERGGSYCRAVVEGKVRNQANVLKYFSKARRDADPDLHQALIDSAQSMAGLASGASDAAGVTPDELRPALMNLEGRAAALYWGVASHLIPGGQFAKRIHRGATDLVNSLLNYGYGILYSQAWTAAVMAGLDPFAGFLHVDRPGKPSFVLDLVEEFRAPVIDRVVFSSLTRGASFRIEHGRLDSSSRREFARRVLERLEARERFGQGKHPLRAVLQKQARNAAAHFRRERLYVPFTASW